MRAMIMAAGVGSRLMPLTTIVPKPMVPIANIPVMEYDIELLRVNNINEIIANLHYLPKNITDYFGDGSKFNVGLTYSQEEILLGTAGGVLNNSWFLKDTFIILSGDGLMDINLTELINFHKQKGGLATIALKKVEEVSQYGVVVTDEENRIVAFQEKPKPQEALSNLVNTGVYVLEPEIFKLIPKGESYDFGKQLFPKLVENKLPFFGYDCKESYWCDVGNVKVYLQANKDVLSGRVKTSLQYKAIDDGVKIEKNVKINNNSVIGKGCIIEEGAVIEDSVIWAKTIVRKNAKITGSAIGSNCIVEEDSEINNSIVIRDVENISGISEDHITKSVD